MKLSVRLLASRVLLFAMLATFLSPSLGWQMVASHEQLEHASVAVSVAGHDHDGDHDDHADAHSSIGHVLTHMPIDLGAATTIRFAPGKESALLSPQFSVHDTPPESHFRPPRPLFSV